jgi:hypothetical protein
VDDLSCYGSWGPFLHKTEFRKKILVFCTQPKKWNKIINKSETSGSNGRSDMQEIFLLLYNPRSNYHSQKNPLLVPILGQMNPVHIVSLSTSLILPPSTSHSHVRLRSFLPFVLRMCTISILFPHHCFSVFTIYFQYR